MRCSFGAAYGYGFLVARAEREASSNVGEFMELGLRRCRTAFSGTITSQSGRWRQPGAVAALRQAPVAKTRTSPSKCKRA